MTNRTPLFFLNVLVIGACGLVVRIRLGVSQDESAQPLRVEAGKGERHVPAHRHATHDYAVIDAQVVE